MFFYFLVLLFIQLFFFWVLHKKSDCFGRRLTQIELHLSRLNELCWENREIAGFMRQIMIQEGKIFGFQCRECKIYGLSKDRRTVCGKCQNKTTTAMMNGTGG